MDDDHCEHMPLAAEDRCSVETLEPLGKPNRSPAATPKTVLPLGSGGGDGSSGAANHVGHTQAVSEATNHINAVAAGGNCPSSATVVQAASPTTTTPADGGAVEAGRVWSGPMSGLAPAAANDSLLLLQEVQEQLGRVALRQQRRARNSVLAGPSFSSTLAEVLVASGMVRMVLLVSCSVHASAWLCSTQQWHHCSWYH